MLSDLYYTSFFSTFSSVVPSTRWARPSALKARMAVTIARCRKTRAGNQHGKQEAGRGEIGIWKYRGLQGPRSDHCPPFRFYSGIEESPLDQSPHQLLS